MATTEIKVLSANGNDFITIEKRLTEAGLNNASEGMKAIASHILATQRLTYEQKKELLENLKGNDAYISDLPDNIYLLSEAKNAKREKFNRTKDICINRERKDIGIIYKSGKNRRAYRTITGKKALYVITSGDIVIHPIDGI